MGVVGALGARRRRWRWRSAWRRLLVGEELRAAEGARARAQAAAVGCADGSRRRRGRTAASGWEETRDKVDKVGLGQL